MAKDRDYLIRVACAYVWADRRAGETAREAAQRAIPVIRQESDGKVDPDADQVLEWACIERTERWCMNELARRQSMRNGKGVLANPDPKWVDEVLQGLREEVGLNA